MKKKTCFVIMPFSKTSDKHDEHYWNNFFQAIKTQMELHSFICKRSETGPYSVIKQIIENLSESDLVVAVLTDLNPNVWYELGIRHSLKNGTLMLLEETQRIPFDINAYGLVKYSDDISLADKLKKEIASYLDKLENSKFYDSPVLDTLKTPIKYKDEFDELKKLILEISKENSDKQLSNFQASRNIFNRILWVDDYPSNNEQVISFFENMDIRFDLAINTTQGIKLFQENGYDLIITDMGRGNEPDAGIRFINELKALNNKNIPPIIVYASSRAISIYGDLARKLGAIATFNGVSNIISYISKFFNVYE